VKLEPYPMKKGCQLTDISVSGGLTKLFLVVLKQLQAGINYWGYSTS
jgi:hypothetical protein